MKTHEQQERTVQDSALDWVIVRPAMLTNGTATGRFQPGAAKAGLAEGKVTRADVACFVLQQLVEDGNLQQAVSIP